MQHDDGCNEDTSKRDEVNEYEWNGQHEKDAEKITRRLPRHFAEAFRFGANNKG